jgi:hypothetical protein
MADDEQLKQLREGLDALAARNVLGREPRPIAYYPDGKPIVSDELLSATTKWALLLEQQDEDRIVGQTRTLYGEKLSTVWLGIDHNFFCIGPPLIFETMLFAPANRKADREWLVLTARGAMTPEKEAAYDERKKHTAKHYPHDQLQLRYATRRQAEDGHEKLKLQCLIPPRWRHFLLGRVCGDPLWLHHDEEVEEWWK